jgi:hypothetical protein
MIESGAKAIQTTGPGTGGCQGLCSAALAGQLAYPGNARYQHGVRKRRETIGINRTIKTRERVARLAGPAARFTRDTFEKPQFSGPMSALQKLAGHDHALDLVGARVDLGDRGRGCQHALGTMAPAMARQGAALGAARFRLRGLP